MSAQHAQRRSAEAAGCGRQSCKAAAVLCSPELMGLIVKWLTENLKDDRNACAAYFWMSGFCTMCFIVTLRIYWFFGVHHIFGACQLIFAAAISVQDALASGSAIAAQAIWLATCYTIYCILYRPHHTI